MIQICIAEGNTIPVTESSPKVESTTVSRNDTVQNNPSGNGGVIGTSTFFNLQHMHTTIVHGMPCVCNVGFRSTHLRDDYHLTEGVGAHKLHTRATTWNEARKICNDEGGHLAIINSKREAEVSIFLYATSIY